MLQWKTRLIFLATTLALIAGALGCSGRGSFLHYGW